MFFWRILYEQMGTFGVQTWYGDESAYAGLSCEKSALLFQCQGQNKPVGLKTFMLKGFFFFSFLWEISFPKTVDLPCFLFPASLSSPSLPDLCGPF